MSSDKDKVVLEIAKEDELIKRLLLAPNTVSNRELEDDGSGSECYSDSGSGSGSESSCSFSSDSVSSVVSGVDAVVPDFKRQRSAMDCGEANVRRGGTIPSHPQSTAIRRQRFGS
jgi:hypothetical protein